jgi:hypothetical protein
MEFKVGDLLIEELFRYGATVGWKPRMGICMEPVPLVADGVHVSVLVQGEVIVSWSRYWRVACRAE